MKQFGLQKCVMLFQGKFIVKSNLILSCFNVNLSNPAAYIKQKQPPGGALKKRCFESIEIELRHGCSPVNLLHIFKTPFPRNKSGWLLLIKIHFKIISAKIILHTNSKYFKNISNIFAKTLDITSKLGQLPPRKIAPQPQN